MIDRGGPGRLVNRDFFAVLVAACSTFVGFNLLFSVVPVIAERHGGRLGAGLSTGVFMITTILAQLSVRSIIKRMSHRHVLAIGLVLIGLPAVLYAVTDQFLVVLAVTAIRGVGFGFSTVICTLLVIAYVDPARRGSAIGMFGLVSSACTTFGPSLGLFLHNHFGNVVFLTAAAATLVLAPVTRLCRPPETGDVRMPATYRELLARSPVRRPLVVLLPGTLLFGGVYSYVPLTSPNHAEAVLLLFGLTMAITRTSAGRLADSMRPELVLATSVLLAALGTIVMVLQSAATMLFIGAALSGLGVGGMMTGSLVVLLGRMTEENYPAASTLWNTSVDAGLALGGLCLGLVAQFAGIDSVFTASFVALAAALPASLLDSRVRAPGVIPTRAP